MRPADWPLRCVNQSAPGRIYGLLVREIFGHVRGQQNEVRTLLIASDVLTPNAALQLRWIVLSTQSVTPITLPNSFLHNVFVRLVTKTTSSGTPLHCSGFGNRARCLSALVLIFE
jgi:hypothetical protein